MRVTLRESIRLPQPLGWRPRRGDKVVVPSKTSDRGWTGIVERIGADMFGETVTVRVPRFKGVRQEWGLSQVRPHPMAPQRSTDSVSGWNHRTTRPERSTHPDNKEA